MLQEWKDAKYFTLPCHLKYLGQYKLNKAAIQQPSLKSPRSWARAIKGGNAYKTTNCLTTFNET